MRGSALLMLMLAGAPSAGAAARQKVVVLDIVVHDSSPSENERARVQRLAAAINEQVLTELSALGTYQVLGSSDVSAMLGLERQRALLGCGDEATSACLAELGGAIGAPYLVSGALARAGSKLRLDLKLLLAERGEVINRQGAILPGEDEVFAVVANLVRALAGPQGAEAPPAAVAVGGPSRAPPVVVGAVGVAAALLGAVLMGVQASQAAALQGSLSSFDILEAERQRASIYGLRAAALATLVCGLAVAAAGAIWFALSGEPESSTKMVAARDGVGFSGALAW